MQWDDSSQAGFSPEGSDDPWLPLTDDWPVRNVAKHLENPGSLLNVYQTLLAYRRLSPGLQTGDYRRVDAPAGCLAYARDGAALTIALNFTDTALELGLSGNVAVTTYLDDEATPRLLRPHEGLIIETG
jgi:glycosidase